MDIRTIRKLLLSTVRMAEERALKVFQTGPAITTRMKQKI